MLSAALTQIVALEQMREFRKKSKAAHEILINIQKFYDKETVVYKIIADNYYDIVSQIIIKRLRDKNQLSQSTSSTFLKPYTDVYGVTLIPQLTDQEFNTAVLNTVKVLLDEKNIQLKQKADEERNDISSALAKLIKIQENFLLNRKPKNENAN